MKRTFQPVFSVMVILGLLVGSTAIVAASQTQQQTGGAPIYLQTGTLYPDPAVNGLTAAKSFRASSDANLVEYYLVQFRGPVEQTWKDDLSALGGEILEYIPDFTFKVRMTFAQAQQAQRLPSVYWVGLYQPAYKFSPDLKRAGIHLYRLRTAGGLEAGKVADQLGQLGIPAAADGADTLVVAVDALQLDNIAAVTEVAWVENYTLHELYTVASSPAANDDAGGSIMGTAAANSRGYDGSTQIIGVADTGLGGGTTTTAHADIPSSRIVSIYNWPGSTDSCFKTITDDGAKDVDSGHGTHVVGSVLSDGDASGIGTGTAPAARLVFQSTENYVTLTAACLAAGYTNGYYLTGIPSNIQQLFLEAYTAGARIHSNSWGDSSAPGAYTTDSLNADTFMWNYKDMLVVVAAGNDGVDSNSDGVINNDSIGAPATAKNILTVGASENQRTDSYPCDTSLSYTTCAAQSGKNSIFTYGAAWPSDYPANPLYSDPSAGNAQQMAAFSSRGPTNDGRIKPDVVAPGTWILSTYSDLYQQGYDSSANPVNSAWQYDGYGFPYSQGYKYMSGTSMATPLSAGGAAVVRDYYKEAQGIDASAALVKATIINSAVDLLDENNDGSNDNDYPIPNNHEGWGLINLDAATDGSRQFVEYTAGLSTSGSASYQVTASGATALKITVAWSDYPSTTSASINLVNDLDVTVTSPSGTVYRGNVFSGGWSASGGSADRRNNVENVYIQTPAAGTYTIQISGYNVPNGPQPFALVVAGGTFGTSVTSTPTSTYTPTRTATATSTRSATPTPSATGSVTITPTPSNTRTATPSSTASPTYTASPTSYAGDTGWLSASANSAVTSSSGDNNGYQTNPTYAYADDSLFAVDLNSGTGTSTSCTATTKDRHIFYNYNISLPASATSVTGIEVRLDARADRTSGSPKICVYLSWDGGITWTSYKSTSTLSTSETSYILGSSTDIWTHSWTLAQMGNSLFRVRLVDVASSTSRDFYLDYAAVRVTYQ